MNKEDMRKLAVELCKNFTLRLLRYDTNLHASPDDIQTFYPEGFVEDPYAHTLPGQLERVTGVAFGGEVRQEIAEFQGSRRRVGPTRALIYSDVIVYEGTIWKGGRKWIFNNQVSFGPNKNWEELEQAVFRSSFLGCHYFGHWLRDDCATHILAAKVSPPFSMPTPKWPDRAHYLSLFEQEQIDLNRAFVKKLIVYDDVAQNEHKAIRFRKLRERLRQTIPASSTEIIYLKRGTGGAVRKLSNERELMELLHAKGVRIIEPEAHSADQIVRQMMNASIVISIEGSQISHALYSLRDQGALLVLQPPDRFFNPHLDWTRALGMKYGVLVGIPTEDGFSIPPDDLLRGIEMMQRAI